VIFKAWVQIGVVRIISLTSIIKLVKMYVPSSFAWYLGLCGHYFACERIVDSVNTGIFQFYFTFIRPSWKTWKWCVYVL